MTTIELIFSVVSMFKILIFYLAAFLLLPSLVIHIDKATIERRNVFFTIFTISSAAIMAGLPLASIFNMTDSVSVIILTVITLVGITVFRKKQNKASAVTLGEKMLIYFLDISDKEMGLVNELKLFGRVALDYLKKKSILLIEKWKVSPILYVVNVVLFVSAIVLRGVQACQHYYLASSDAYLHLLWTKYFVHEGLYRDGIYPHGIHVVVAYVSELFNVDAYLVYRYLAPGISLLILFGLYQFVRRHFFTNLYAPSLAVAAYLFVTSIPTQPWRQLSVLPQEYALIFVLPTLHFLMEYGSTKEIRYLKLFTLGLIITGFVHSYALFFILLGSFFYLVLHVKTFFEMKLIKSTVLYTSVGILIGSSPMVLALLVGKRFHRSFEFAVSSISTSAEKIDMNAAISNLISKDFVLIAVCFLAVLMLLMSQHKASGKSNIEDRLDRLGFTFTTIVLYVLYRSADFNLPSPMLPDRVGVFLSVFISVLFGAVFGLFVEGLSRLGLKSALQGAVSAAFIVLMVAVYGIDIPTATQYEYDQSAKAYVSISNNPESRELTLIAPQEQFQQIYGRGYHYQLWQLIADQTDANKKEVIIPTTEIYVFVEKIPFGYKEPVNMQMAKGNMPSNINDPSIYYTEYREIVEAKAYYWAEDFKQRYPEQVSVYYEDAVLKIYRITQDILTPLNLKTGAPAEVYAQ